MQSWRNEVAAADEPAFAARFAANDLGANVDFVAPFGGGLELDLLQGEFHFVQQADSAGGNVATERRKRIAGLVLDGCGVKERITKATPGFALVVRLRLNQKGIDRVAQRPVVQYFQFHTLFPAAES